ncbi:TPA: helix-turn-helix domain-containing protein [Citrobacter koseri]|nr:helix-turn-helix domain-containing protein [Citrobacter koseri]
MDNLTLSIQVINGIVKWIDINLHKPLRINDIARRAGYSRRHLQRLFLQHKGECIGQYIRHRRLENAAWDLRNTNQKIYDISMKYCFDSQQTFTKIFTRVFYLSPGMYRKKHQPFKNTE